MAICLPARAVSAICTIQANYIGGHDFARDDMVEQDVGQLLLVLGQEQALQCAGGQGGEGIIGGGKDSEGASALQGLDQARRPESSHQGGEAAIGYGDINNALGCHGFFSRRKEDRVDHMDDTIRGFDVGDDDLDGLVQVNAAHIYFDGDLLASQGGISHLSIQANHIRGHDFAGDDMVEQDVGQLLLVLGQEQALQGAGRQSGEGIIGGGKDSEGASALQRLDQSAACRAATRVVKRPSATAMSTMSFSAGTAVGAGGWVGTAVGAGVAAGAQAPKNKRSNLLHEQTNNW